ncbi:DUF4352 domain-containing protein [Enterococcus avium]|uniref:DUF4352 domain-containing protein n=1 Tax=Enterococcus avium TaxID=33945 RepID=UPI001F583C27|nr:DUF4352 domain-containing protein [Enterococcus avium]
MKKIVLTSVLLCLFSLTGCSNATTNSSNDSTKIESVNNKRGKQNQNRVSIDKETKFANLLEITPKNIKSVSSGKNDKKTILTIDIHAKNTDDTENGLGAYDFVLKVNNKELEPYSEANNFGDTIDAGKELDGQVSFEVPKKSNNAELIYKMKDKKAASWNIKY